MIPHGRTAVDAAGAAELLGMSYKTFRNRNAAAEYGLRPLNPGRRKLLYDRAQVVAARDGRPLPTWPTGTGQHPEDLLDEQDAAEVLGVAYSTVRKDRSDDRLGGWVEVCGVAHISRSALARAVAERPGRGVGGGRPRKQA